VYHYGIQLSFPPLQSTHIISKNGGVNSLQIPEFQNNLNFYHCSLLKVTEHSNSLLCSQRIHYLIQPHLYESSPHWPIPVKWLWCNVFNSQSYKKSENGVPVKWDWFMCGKNFYLGHHTRQSCKKAKQMEICGSCWNLNSSFTTGLNKACV